MRVSTSLRGKAVAGRPLRSGRSGRHVSAVRSALDASDLGSAADAYAAMTAKSPVKVRCGASLAVGGGRPRWRSSRPGPASDLPVLATSKTACSPCRRPRLLPRLCPSQRCPFQRSLCPRCPCPR